MELRHLRHFVAVAEELHFARAAERLGMEQSPLSHSIRNLEAELGVPLFHRTTRRTWLTQAGNRFYAEALRVLEAVDVAKSAARNQAPDGSGHLVIGLAEHAAGEPFTRFLFELEHRTASVAVDLREVAPAEAPRQVEGRALDMAIVLDPANGSNLRKVRAWSEALVLIAPLGHSYAEREHVSLTELTDQRFVMPYSAASPGYTGQIEALLSRYGVRPAAHVAVKHQNIMVSLTSAGRGLALMPESIAHGLTTVAVVPIAEPDALITSWLIYRDEQSSDALSFALEVAASIGEPSSDPV